ncbi:MAG: hypothetical protein SFU86_01895 [Pirellulaceae bacterium]|nr:hypothetical protein [Pirellulaceae bacterium]
MISSVLCVVLAVSGQTARYGEIRKDEIEYQQEAFKAWWGSDLVRKLDDLPTESIVPEYRVPYAGHDYPDHSGGTVAALAKYDRAFNAGQQSAVAFERSDISGHGRYGSSGGGTRRGLFGRIRRSSGPPSWYGHCNGWTAATIRHAEPQNNVVRNGVTFTPADIKGMLAEIYMYSPTEFLGGLDNAINPATLHLVLCNWLGRGSHPVGMETALGEVVINFPVYSYKVAIEKLSDKQYDCRMSIRYAMNTPREYDKGPKFNRTLAFHYALDLDDEGNITGGRYYGDTNQIDMLWTPLKPVQGGEKGNERGNPYLNVKEVLAIWRESVPEEIRKQWLNIDPTDEDRLPEADEAKPAEATASADPAATPATPAVPAEAPATAGTTPAPAATTPATPAPAATTPATPAAESDLP